MSEDNTIIENELKKLGYWNDIYSKKNYFGTGPTKLAIFAKELLEKNSLQKILELGCGQGRDCLFFAKEGFDVFGFDISQDAISFVEECRIAENLGNLKVVVHDVTKPLDFNSEFDLIYSNLALQFFDLNQLGAIFDNINKIMQKNSLFLFSTKKPGDKYHNFGTKIDDDTFEYNRIKRYFFDQDSLRALLEKNFKILIFDSAQHENLDKSVSKWWKILVQKK